MRRDLASLSRAVRLLASVLIVYCLLVTATGAAVQPPLNDNYLSPVPLSLPSSTSGSIDTLTRVASTIGATLQSNLLSPCGATTCPSGPAETSTCDGVAYAGTVWFAFTPPNDGEIEIRTRGFRDVITLDTSDPQTREPQRVACAPGSGTSNVLLAAVHHGVAYRIQIGGRNGAGGPFELLVNYAAEANLVVAPFLADALIGTIRGAAATTLLERIDVYDLTSGEQVSYACSGCLPPATESTSAAANTVVFEPRAAPQVSTRTRLVVAVTAPAQIGRFKVYGLDPKTATLSLLAKGCLAPSASMLPAAASTGSSALGSYACPAQATGQAGSEYVLWQGDDDQLYEKLFAGGQWTAPLLLAARGVDSSPAVAVHTGGEQDVFWRGTAGNLIETWFTGSWNPPQGLGDTGLGAGPAAGVDEAGNEYVFWEGTKRLLWETTFTAGQWSEPVSPNSGLLGSPPAVAVHPGGEQDVFWRGNNGNLWEMTYTNQWNEARDLGDGKLGSAPAVGLDAGGNDYVFWEGTDHRLWETWSSHGAWNGPIPLPSGLIASAPTVAVHADGQLDVFWRGTDDHLWEMVHAGIWSLPEDLGGHLASSPTASVAPAYKS